MHYVSKALRIVDYCMAQQRSAAWKRLARLRTSGGVAVAKQCVEESIRKDEDPLTQQNPIILDKAIVSPVDVR